MTSRIWEHLRDAARGFGNGPGYCRSQRELVEYLDEVADKIANASIEIEVAVGEPEQAVLRLMQALAAEFQGCAAELEQQIEEQEEEDEQAAATVATPATNGASPS